MISEQTAKAPASIISVGELLQKTDLRIPQYQRPYKWTAKNITQLFEDIAVYKDKSSYRLGTIVFHQDKDGLNIVDGQQRTITMLLTVRALIACVNANRQLDTQDY